MKEKLLELLQKRRFSRAELAQELGVSAKTLSFWISEKSQPSEKNCKKVEQLLAEVEGNGITAQSKNIRIQGILLDRGAGSVEEDDDEAYYKNELTKEKRAIYYKAKRIVRILEEDNRSRLILFPSIGGAKKEWYKVAGTSLLLYKYRIGPRLGRKVKILRDSDKREKFMYGISSIHWLDEFAKRMAELGYKDYSETESGVVIFELGKEYTAQEIKELATQAKRERELLQDTIRPKKCFPEVYGMFIELAKILPIKIRKMDSVYRDIMGKELMAKLISIGGIYYRMADCHMDVNKARNEMLTRIDDMLGLLAIIEEVEAIPEAGVLRLGTSLINFKEAVKKMYEKKVCHKYNEIGSEAKS